MTDHTVPTNVINAKVSLLHFWTSTIHSARYITYTYCQMYRNRQATFNHKFMIIITNFYYHLGEIRRYISFITNFTYFIVNDFGS